MSNLVSAKVHKKVFGSATRKAVMIYFSDKASDGGEGIWASKTTIAAELEMHRATVIRTINELVSEGILIVVGDRRHRNGATVEYDISMCAVDQLPDVELPRSESVPRTPKDDLTRRTARPVAEGDPLPSKTTPALPPVPAPLIGVSQVRDFKLYRIARRRHPLGLMGLKIPASGLEIFAGSGARVKLYHRLNT